MKSSTAFRWRVWHGVVGLRVRDIGEYEKFAIGVRANRTCIAERDGVVGDAVDGEHRRTGRVFRGHVGGPRSRAEPAAE